MNVNHGRTTEMTTRLFPANSPSLDESEEGSGTLHRALGASPSASPVDFRRREVWVARSILIFAVLALGYILSMDGVRVGLPGNPNVPRAIDGTESLHSPTPDPRPTVQPSGATP